jgi:hypothetical protein
VAGAPVSRRAIARYALPAVFAVLLAVGLWNVRSYPIGYGYDSDHHIAYANSLLYEHRLPAYERRGETEAPPVYYAAAATATRVGIALGMGEPRRLAVAMNLVFLLGTVALVVALARLLFPGRAVLVVAAAAFVALVPVAVRSAAMFHPETLNLFLSALAVYLTARMAVTRRFGVVAALPTALVVGLDLLVRKGAMLTFGAIVVGLGALAALRYGPPLRVAASAATVAVVGVLMYLPWAVHVRNLERPPSTGPENPALPVHASYLTRIPVDTMLNEPWRPNLTNLALPTLYTDTWGDYFGAFEWVPGEKLFAKRRTLRLQTIVGAVPTALVIGGWAALIALAFRRRRELIPVALFPAVALAGVLWRGSHPPSPDGDLLKASYLLVALPACALAFGFAVDRLWPRPALRAVLLLALGVAAVASLRLNVWGSPLANLL